MQQSLYRPPITDNALRLILVFCAGFVMERAATLLFGANVGALVLRFDRGFEPIQLVTHVFAFGAFEPWGGLVFLFFECLMLYMFGGELEQEWGRHNFLRLFLFGLLGGLTLGAVSAAFLPLLLYGFGAGTAAVLVAYAMIWPDRQALLFFVIPVRMKWLVLVIFVMLFTWDFPNQFILQLGGALAGALFVYYYARRGRQSPAGGRASAAPAGILGGIQESLRRRRLAKKQGEIDHRIEMKAEVDRLLEKISRDGIQSLSRKERRFLDQASGQF